MTPFGTGSGNGGHSNHRSQGKSSPFERRLTERLHALADHAPDRPRPTASPEHGGHDVGPGPSFVATEDDVRRRAGAARYRALVAAAAAVLVVAGGVAMWRAGGRATSEPVDAVAPAPETTAPSDTTTGSSEATGDEAVTSGFPTPADEPVPTDGGVWETLADSPMVEGERVYMATAWTGSEAVFWAGTNRARSFAYTDGAAFDPVAGTWRSLRVPGWGHPGLTATYSEGAFFATAKGGGSRLGVVTGTTTDVSPPPDMVLGALVSTGVELFGIGPTGLQAESYSAVGAARYHPDTDTWDDPVFADVEEAGGLGFTGLFAENPPVWTGAEIVVLTDNGSGVAFDPTGGSWRRFAAPADDAAIHGSVITDYGLMVAFPSPNGVDMARLTATGWQRVLGQGPVAFPSSEETAVSIIGAGPWIMLVGPGTDPVSVHLPTDKRFRYPDGPRVFEPNTVWTGHELIVWGGAGNSTDNGRLTNMIWRPPNPAQETGPMAGDTTETAGSCDLDTIVDAFALEPKTVTVEPTDGPLDLADRSAAVLRGTFIQSEPVTVDRLEGTRLEVEPHDLLTGSDDLGDRVINDLWIPSPTTEPLTVDGAAAEAAAAFAFIAFLERELEPLGAWVVDPEGLWIACDGGSPARPALTRPSADGWSAVDDRSMSLDDLWVMLGGAG